MDSDLIPISALSHYSFCPRRCAFIHIEHQWEENRFTAEGRIMHEHVHEEGNQMRNSVRIERGIPLLSLRMGLVGRADVVEYYKQLDDTWLPFPIEYKRGKPKMDNSDKIQLCAQAMCLEEMLHINIAAGAIFYGKTRRRLDVIFTNKLHQETELVARQVHALIKSGITPKPVYEKRCESCSILDICLPKSIQKRRSVKQYITRMTNEY